MSDIMHDNDHEGRKVITSAATSSSRSGIFLPIRRLLRDRSGIGAVEFAILAPILIAVYLSCFELTMGFSFSKRVTRAAGTVGDLVTQQGSVDKAFLATMIPAAKSIFVPYDVDSLSTAAKNPFNLKITGVTVDASSNATVAWSWQIDGTRPYAVGATVTVPTEMRVANSFLVKTEIAASYPLLLFLPTNFTPDNRAISLNREIFYQQRVGDKITCSDC